MRTDTQNQASRTNGARSRGPVTSEGKAISSRNSTKSGIYANSEIIPGENPDDLQALADSYRAEYQPQGPTESALVDMLVHSEWLLRRFRRAEVKLTERMDAIPSVLREISLFDDKSVNEERLQRRINSTQRNFHQAVKELKALQAARPKAQPVELPIESSSEPRRIEPKQPAATPVAHIMQPPTAPAKPPKPVFENLAVRL
jgi:hypothetical protein